MEHLHHSSKSSAKNSAEGWTYPFHFIIAACKCSRAVPGNQGVHRVSLSFYFRAYQLIFFSSSTKSRPVRVYDPQSNQFIRIRLQCNCGPGDNPAQSEISGHIGSSGNFQCRKCMVGGTTKHKATNSGYSAMFIVCIKFSHINYYHL